MASIHYNLIYFDSIPSTQDMAHELIREGRMEEDTVIIADEQTKGRGRGGNAWVSCKGNLYATFIFKVLAILAILRSRAHITPEAKTKDFERLFLRHAASPSASVPQRVRDASASLPDTKLSRSRIPTFSFRCNSSA